MRLVSGGGTHDGGARQCPGRLGGVTTGARALPRQPPPSPVWGFETTSPLMRRQCCAPPWPLQLRHGGSAAFPRGLNGRGAAAASGAGRGRCACEQPDSWRLAVKRLAMTTALAGTHGRPARVPVPCADRHGSRRIVSVRRSVDRLGQSRTVTCCSAQARAGSCTVSGSPPGPPVDAPGQPRRGAATCSCRWALRPPRRAPGASCRRPASESSGKAPASPAAVRLTPRKRDRSAGHGRGVQPRDRGGQPSISPRTVEYHLHNSPTKLGITARNQLNRALRETRPLTTLGSVGTDTDATVDGLGQS